jgi:threonine-phosphate decarboxylase
MSASMEHGGNLYAAARESGRRLDKFIDFSASINPLGPSPRAMRAIVAAFDLVTHYPDPDCVALRQALAAHYHLGPEQLVIGNGSTELIHLLPRALSIKHALIIGPTFSEYARAIFLAGGQVISVNAKRSEHFRPPIAQALEILRTNETSIDTVFLCNPNSPTGQAMEVKDVLELIQAIARRGGRGIIDEAYVEYCEERSVLSQLSSTPGLVVLRSFTKFYALPALRIGCLAGDAEVIRRMKQWQPPWSVNAFSQAAVLASINDVRYAERSRTLMDRERPRFSNDLQSLPGITVHPSAANFLLVELPPRHSAKKTAGALARHGLLVRDCSHIEECTARMMRVAVRTALENRRLVTALRRVLFQRGEAHGKA